MIIWMETNANDWIRTIVFGVDFLLLLSSDLNLALAKEGGRRWRRSARYLFSRY